MNILEKARLNILKSLEQALSRKIKEDLLEIPPDTRLGDFAFPCFFLAKELKKSPELIAQELREKIKLNKLIRIEVKGPYLNFFLNKSKLAEEVLEKIKKEKDHYGYSKIGKRKKVVVEYIAPNANKPLHLGHLRNGMIGSSLSNLLEAAGYKAKRVNLVNDRGIHICKAMLAYIKYGKDTRKTPENRKTKGDHFVGDYYILFGKKAEKDPLLIEEAQKLLQKWEAGDRKTIALWRKIRGWVLKGHKETYQKIGVKFDKTYYESDFYKKGKNIILHGFKKNIFFKEKGAIIADLKKFNLPNKVLLRSDGTSLYIGQDLYLARLKYKDFKFHKSIYVVGSEQDMSFKQLFSVLKLLSYPWASACYHLSHGMIYLPEGRMKSRSGTKVEADDFLNKLTKFALEEVNKRYDFLSEKESLLRAGLIALSALKYYVLQVEPKTNMNFNPKESLSFSGKTGPYLLYTYARICSIMKKALKTDEKKINFSLLKTKEEEELILILAKFPEVIKKAALEYNPSELAKYLYELAKVFASYYHDQSVIKAEKEMKKARIFLLKGIQQVLKNGMGLLGIEAVEEM